MEVTDLRLANILLVEDCDADAAFFRDFFERQRIRNKVTRVISYQDALLHIQSGEMYDLLVVDMRIPGNGGLELIERIRTMPGYQEVPVVITSGMEVPKDVKAAKKLEVLVYMVKPLSKEKWDAAVDELKLHIGLLVMVKAAAIPGDRKTPVTVTICPLAFRKHQCDNAALTETMGCLHGGVCHGTCCPQRTQASLRRCALWLGSKEFCCHPSLPPRRNGPLVN
jgi:CheY-like chemotaxis protein